jgi:protein TonB
MSRPSARTRVGALGVSLLLHALVVALLVSPWGRTWVRSLAPGAVERPRGGGGGGGGGREHGIAYVVLAPPAAPAPAAVPPPRRRATVPPEAVTPPAPVTPAAAAAPPRDSAPAPVAASGAPADGAGAGTGPGQGPGTGGGQGGGTGGGVGAGTGPASGGQGGRGVAPEPRQLVLPPPDSPKSLRGRQVEVTFFVGVDGRVEKVAVDPQIADGGFARKFDETMRNYRFRPARSPEGAPVPGSVTITVSFF